MVICLFLLGAMLKLPQVANSSIVAFIVTPAPLVSRIVFGHREGLCDFYFEMVERLVRFRGKRLRGIRSEGRRSSAASAQQRNWRRKWEPGNWRGSLSQGGVVGRVQRECEEGKEEIVTRNFAAAERTWKCQGRNQQWSQSQIRMVKEKDRGMQIELYKEFTCYSAIDNSNKSGKVLY